MKTRIFIASSLEAWNFAYALQDHLTGELTEATVWDQDVFEASSFGLESLLQQLDQSDVGIFVFSPDDITRIRGKEYSTARDNVLFELGLFIGRLGRKRNFIVQPKGLDDFRLPSDLQGLTTLSYDAQREDKNWKAAVGPASQRIKNVLQTFVAKSENQQTGDATPAAVAPAVKGRLNLNLPEQFTVGHFMGNPLVWIFTGLLNSGEQPLLMRKLICVLKHENGTVWQLPAQTYISRQVPTQPGQTVPEFPMLSLSLKPGEPWNEMVRYYKLFPDSRQQEISDLGWRMRNDLMEKQQKQSHPPGAWIEVDAALQQEAVAFFEQEFDLVKGKYQMFLAAYTGAPEPAAVYGFRFSLLANALQALRAAAFEGYKYGAGVYFANSNPAAVINPSLEALDEATVRAAFTRLEITPQNVT